MREAELGLKPSQRRGVCKVLAESQEESGLYLVSCCSMACLHTHPIYLVMAANKNE